MEPYKPPIWVIDLSLQPRHRYRELARRYSDQVQELTKLYEELLRDFAVPEKCIPLITNLSRLLLRRVNDTDQTEELRGISEESGIPMYLLVAFNVILDLLMGCTSGGARSLERGQPLSEATMLHFRTLDWTMDPLRKVVVQLDFVKSNSATAQRVLTSSITYVGFIGVLTGVRPGLSLSLNFRGLHDNSTKAAQFRFYLHHVLVLLGRRPSIASYLRSYLIGHHERPETRQKNGNNELELLKSQQLDLAQLYEKIKCQHTTAAYLIMSNGSSTISVEKDFKTAVLRQSQDFIATTSHDVVDHRTDQKEVTLVAKAVQSAPRHGFNAFLEESEDRLKCISARWSKLVNTRHKDQSRKGLATSLQDVASTTTLTRKQMVEWVRKYPTMNECTHYNVVMDAKSGQIVYSMAYPEPIENDFQVQLEL